MDKVQPREIRVLIEGGVVLNVGLGKDIPQDVRITINDFDIEGSTPDDDSRIQDNGYGNMAFCGVLHDAGEEVKSDSVDEDGTVWL